MNAGEPLTVARLARVLRALSEAQYYHQSAGHATRPIGLHHIHFDDHDVVRIDNLVVAGTRDPEQSSSDIARLGSDLRPLVADAQPGATRMSTLLSWMRGEGISEPLDWEQVREISERIETQLIIPFVNEEANVSKKRRPAALFALALTALLAVLTLSIWAFLKRPQKTPPIVRAVLPGDITISAGTHPRPDDTPQDLPAFRIMAHEVTIGQYAEFLEILEMLAKDGRETVFNHPDQPVEKKSHLPQDWDTLLIAAKSNSTWNERAVTLDSPVVGVDWWDAAAYAEWKKAHLPSQEEWHAAAHYRTGNPAAIPAGDWMPVDTQNKDRTTAGLLGLAGSVSEWTGEPAMNPANPLGERSWVIIGGSYLKSGSNALSREWTSDRLLRRKDIGFRVVFDEE